MDPLRVMFTIGLLLIESVRGSVGDLPLFVTPADDPAVTQCQDTLSYLCGNTTGDSCISPRSFCDGVVSCPTGWDELDCDAALPSYEPTSALMRTSRVYWMSLSVPACAKLCDNTPQCEGFSWHGQYQRCQLHTEEGKEETLNAQWTSYRRTATKTNATRGARYLFNLLDDATPATSIADHEKLSSKTISQVHQHRSARAARGAQCGKQSVFYMPPRKGQASTRIVGGSRAPYGAFPWQAHIKVRRGGYWVHHCGGAVVSPQHIVTAAHCMVTHNRDQYLVVLGDHTLEDREEHEMAYPIDKIVIHPAYNKLEKQHDLAVLRLRAGPAKRSAYSARAAPVCLPAAFERPEAGTECVVSGWGLTNANDDASLASTLRAARVAVISEKRCGSPKVYGGKRHFFPDGTLCAGYLGGGVDACSGDSGGPMVCQLDGRFQLLGVVSWGDSCAGVNKPGVYTRVAQYTEWIQQNLN